MEIVCGMKKIIPASENGMWETETVVQTIGAKVLEPLARVGQPLCKQLEQKFWNRWQELGNRCANNWNKSFGTVSKSWGSVVFDVRFRFSKLGSVNDG